MSVRTKEDVLLDAARDLVMAVGVRRTTASDVARRAEVSRMTLYRSFADVSALLSALMAREFGALVDSAYAESAELPTARERLVEGTVRGVGHLAGNPLFERVLCVDPELLLPYVTDRLGETQRQAMSFFSALLEEGARDGSIRPLDRRAAAYCLQMAAQGFVLSTRVAEAEGLPAEALAELRDLLDGYLRPR